MVELSASMERRTITATITGMAEEYDAGRTFYWYLDGKLVKTERILASLTTLDYTYTAVPYLAEHTVTVQISSYDDAYDFGSYSDSVTDPMALWSWSSGNWSATASQTKAAYTAISTQGRTADFNHLVWNDLVELFANARSGWNPLYATLDDTMMSGSGDQLTADRFNSLVLNIGNPWMFWAYRPSLTGYLGRLAVRGHAKYGSSADKVYGSYLIELARMLNVLIDAEGEFNAGYAKRMYHTSASDVYTSESLSMRSPASRRMELYEVLYWAGRQRLTAPASRHLERTGKLWTVPNLTFRADASKHLAIRNRIYIPRDLTLFANNERAMNADLLVNVLADILFSPALSGSLDIAASSGTAPNVTLVPITSSPLGVEIHFGPGAAVTLSPSPSEPMGVVVQLNPVTDIILSPTESTLFNATVSEVSAILAELSPSASGILGITSGHTSTQDVQLSRDASVRMLYTGTVNITDVLALAALNASYMSHSGGGSLLWQYLLMNAPKSARLAYDSTADLKPILDAVLVVPTAARMALDDTLAVAAQFYASLSVPVSAHMDYQVANNLTALLAAEMYSTASVRMEYIAQNTVVAALNADLSSSEAAHMAQDVQTAVKATLDALMTTPASVRMEYAVNNTMRAALDAVLRDPASIRMEYWVMHSAKGVMEALLNTSPSVHMTVSVSEKIGLSDLHELSDTPSLYLDATRIQSESQMQDTELAPVDSLPFAADIADSMNDTADVDLSASPSAVLEGGGSGSGTESDSAMDVVSGVPLSGDYTVYSSGDYSLSYDESVSVVVVDFRSVSQFAAALELEGEVFVEWVTQDGSDLYIRGVWFSWNDDENLQIDTLEFYPHIQTGSNLYIRSAWDSYQDQAEVNVDLDVFYKPIQTESNLYIRSDIFGGE